MQCTSSSGAGWWWCGGVRGGGLNGALLTCWHPSIEPHDEWFLSQRDWKHTALWTLTRSPDRWRNVSKMCVTHSHCLITSISRSSPKQHSSFLRLRAGWSALFRCFLVICALKIHFTFLCFVFPISWFLPSHRPWTNKQTNSASRWKPAWSFW